jgi:hypothetical protein
MTLHLLANLPPPLAHGHDHARIQVRPRIDFPRTYGAVVGGGAGAGAVFVAAGGVASSIADAWSRVLRTTWDTMIIEMTTARIIGNQPLPLSSSGSVDIVSSVGFLTSGPESGLAPMVIDRQQDKQ